jgi:uncharacterized protein HemX
MAINNQDETRTTNPGHTTIIRERGGSSGLIIALVLVVALGVAAFLYMRGQNSEIARDSAVAGAAEQVGESAQRAGAAVEDAANNAAPE